MMHKAGAKSALSNCIRGNNYTLAVHLVHRCCEKFALTINNKNKIKSIIKKEGIKIA